MAPTSVREYMYGVGSTVPGDFLNHLEDLLYAYADSILPTSTGTQVLVQATVGDEAQVVIDREFWMVASSILAPVSGPPGDYSVYVGASTVPTAHSTGIKGFDLVVSTAPPAYDHVRKVATLDWTGSSIGRVLLDARKLNAAQLDGYVATTTPLDEIIPVASSNGKIDNGFRPTFPGVDAELGEVIDYWRPPGSIFSVPSSWALCDGSVIPSGQHAFGAFPLALPDLRDKMIYGANPSALVGAAGTPSNLASSAPGIGGIKAAHMQDASLAHSHDQAPHMHSVAHTHSLGGHGHDLPAHRHGTDEANAEIDNAAGADTRNVNHTANTDTTPAKPTNSTFNEADSTFDPGTASSASVTGVGSPSIEGRPGFYGFARIMKVRYP